MSSDENRLMSFPDPRLDAEKIEEAIYALTLASTLESIRRAREGFPPTVLPEEGEDAVISLIKDPVNLVCFAGVHTLIPLLRATLDDESQLGEVVARIAKRIETETGHSIPSTGLWH